MRSSLAFAIFCVLTAGILACDSGTLVGPEAQRAYARGANGASVVPTDALVFVNDRPVPPGQRLDLDPTRITRIEILKGETAARAYGDAARAGVIRIYTTPALESFR